MESSNGMSQGQDTNSSPGLTSSTATAPVQTSHESSEERSFRQSEVNEIVKRAKYGAVEDYRRLQTEQPDYARQKYGDSNQQSNQANQRQDSGFSEDHYRKIAAEEAQRLRDEWIGEARNKTEAENAQRIVQNFYQKISPGKDKYEDFEKVIGDIEYARFPNVVHILADHVENAEDILYEFGNDRIKMSNLEELALRSPKDAIAYAKRLSQSMKDNADTKNLKIPNAPLSQMRPSNTGTDNGVMSVKDYRAKYRV